MKFFKQIDTYYIITLLFLLLSANANIISSSDIAWLVILLFMCGVAINRKLLVGDTLKQIGVFSLVYLLFVTVRDLAINSLDTTYLLSDIIYLFKFVFLSFIFCTILKEKVAVYLVKVIYHLTIVSLFFFAFQLVGLGELIFKFSSMLNLKASMAYSDYTNFLIFTYIKGKHAFRNSGFVWEPGAFGCFLIIAMMLNLFLNKFIFEKKTYIFIIAILTTLATTDYLVLLIVLFMIYRYRVRRLNIWAIVLLIIGALIVLNVPFLGDKITGTYYEDMDDLRRMKYLEIFYRHRDMQIPLNRFASMIYLCQEFGYQLILGVSNKYDVIVNSKFNINISNGIFDLMAKFGFVGLVYLVYRYAKFCLAQVLKIEYLIYCILALLVIGFGEPVMFLPIIVMFIFIDPKQLNIHVKHGGRSAKKTKLTDALNKYR